MQPGWNSSKVFRQKTKIDDQIKSEDLTFYFLVYNRFLERIEESKGYYNDILTQKFDYDRDLSEIDNHIYLENSYQWV